MNQRKKIAVSLMAAVGLTLLIVTCLSGLGLEAAASWKDDGYYYADVYYEQKREDGTWIDFSIAPSWKTKLVSPLLFYKETSGFTDDIEISLQDAEKYVSYFPFTDTASIMEESISGPFDQNRVIPLHVKFEDGSVVPVYFFVGLSEPMYGNKDQFDEEVAKLNETMKKLYALVDTIEAQEEITVGGYYPEHAELLKQVFHDVRVIMEYDTYSKEPVYDDTFEFPNYYKEGTLTNYSLATTTEYATGMRQIVEAYLAYVEEHKVQKPEVTEFALNNTSGVVDNTAGTITINGASADYQELDMKEAVFTLPEGITAIPVEGTYFGGRGEETPTYLVSPCDEADISGSVESCQKAGLCREYSVLFSQDTEDYVTEISLEAECGAEISQGARSGLDTTIKGVGNYSREILYSCNHPEWLSAFYPDNSVENRQGNFTVSTTAPVGGVLTFTVKSVANPKKTATTQVTIVEPDALVDFSIKAPDGYEIVDGVMEVYPGTEITLETEVETTGNYQWVADWYISGTGKDAGMEIDATGKVTIPSNVPVGSEALVELLPPDEYDDRWDEVTLKVVKEYYTIKTSSYPEGLQGVTVTATPSQAKKGETVKYQYAPFRGAVDESGQKYLFDHWETDEANRELRTASTSNELIHGSVTASWFKMPDRDVELTAVYEKSWQVSEQLTGAEGTDLSELCNGLVDYQDGTEVSLYYYKNRPEVKGLVVESIQVHDSKGNEIPFQWTDRENDSETVNDSFMYIRFTMPADEVTVSINLIPDPDKNKSLSIEEVTGDLISGTAGSASARVSAKGYEDGVNLIIGESYSQGTLKDEADRTAGLSFSIGAVTDEKAEVTVRTESSVPEGTYYFAVTDAEGKKKAVSSVTVLAEDEKYLTVKSVSLELKEGETGEAKIKGSGRNLPQGTSVTAVETDEKGQEKTLGVTEGLSFERGTISGDSFTIRIHLSKSVPGGTYYFKVKAADIESETATLTVTRKKEEVPPEEDTYAIRATCNPNQGSIEVKVDGETVTAAKEGDTVTLTAVPKTGYKLKNWSINQDMTAILPSEGTLTDTTVAFIMPAGDVTVGAAFESTGGEEPSGDGPAITAFVVAGANGVIDQTTGAITVSVPYGTDVKALKPAIATQNTVSITPDNGAAVDFTDSVVYTLEGTTGELRQYVVTVYVNDASISDSLWDQIVSPTGPRMWWKQAESIKENSGNRYPRFW